MPLSGSGNQFVRAQKELVENYNKTRDSVKKQGGEIEKATKDAAQTVQE
jgi:hypothetical protein